MFHFYSRALEKFEDLRVQLISHRAPFGFVTSDNPVVLMRGPQVGAHQGIALLDATNIFFPITPRLACLLTTGEQGDRVAAHFVVQRLNHLTWRNAITQIACHPAEDWRMALARQRATA